MHTHLLRCFFSCIFPETTWWCSEGLSEQLALHVGPTFGEPALVPLPQGNDSEGIQPLGAHASPYFRYLEPPIFAQIALNPPPHTNLSSGSDFLRVPQAVGNTL